MAFGFWHTARVATGPGIAQQISSAVQHAVPQQNWVLVHVVSEQGGSPQAPLLQ
jgi:hypothetical protein